MADDLHYDKATDGKKSQEPDSWRTLLYDFTQNTTLHGIQYVFQPTKWFLRRIVWFLAVTAALTAFIVLNFFNVRQLMSNPKKVNVDVSIRDNLTFPSITICNYNFHRFSKVMKMGLFDTFYSEYSPEAKNSINGDYYQYNDMCPSNKIEVGIASCPFKLDPLECMLSAPTYNDISSTACERLCSIVHSKTCNGFWYLRSKRTCFIWEPVVAQEPQSPDESDESPQSGDDNSDDNRDDINTQNADSVLAGNNNRSSQSESGFRDAPMPVPSNLQLPTQDNPDGFDLPTNNSEDVFGRIDSIDIPQQNSLPSLLPPGEDNHQLLNSFDLSAGAIGQGRPDNQDEKNKDDSAIPCDFEYYRKIRVIESRNMICKFEDGGCSGLNLEPLDETTENDLETLEPFIITEAKNPLEDFSTQSARGSYMYLFETNKRQGFHAIAMTYLFSGAGKCLEFYYTFVGDGVTQLDVSIVGVDNVPVNTTTLTGNKDSLRWQRFYTKVPDKVVRLVLRAQRPSGQSSGLAIDDISLMACYTFIMDGDGTECLRDRDGRSYMGNMKVTRTGVPCLNSTCRNPNYEVRPWCYTSSDHEEFDYCNITHCECGEHEFQCADSKICLPNKFQCDGKKDCEDYTDEYEICEKERSIDCDFQSEFACGYQVGPLYTDIDVMYVSGINNSDELGPKIDQSGSRIGSFIIMDIQGSKEGDRVSYWSPIFKHDAASHCLKFWMRAIGDITSIFNALRINMVDADFIFGSLVHLQTFELSKTSYPDWTEVTVFIPEIVGPEYYRFIWEFTMGFPYKSSLALDQFSISQCVQEVPDYVNTNAFDAMTSFQCDTFGPYCSMHQRSTSAHAKWQWVPKQFLANITAEVLQNGDCGPIRVTLEGHFETPLYPDPLLEDGTFCMAHIMVPAGSSISLNFPALTGDGKIQITTIPLLNNTSEPQEIPVYSNKNVEFRGVTEVKMYLVYDGIGMAASFRGFYNVSLQDNQDYVLAAEYTGPFSNVHHQTQIFSDVMLFTQPHCMSFLSYAKSRDVKVFLAGRKIVEIKGSRATIAKAWFPALFNINLPPGKYNILISQTMTRAEPGIYAVVDEMMVKLGRCQDIDTDGNATCDFSTSDQCGYLDVSSSTTRWTRDVVDWHTVPPRNDDQAPAMVLHHDRGRRSEVIADLLTPRFSVSNQGCLSFTYSAKQKTTISVSLLASTLYLYDLTSGYVGDVLVEGSVVQKASIPISGQHHYALFSLRKENTNSVMIDDVQVSDNNCDSATTSSSSRKRRSTDNSTDSTVAIGTLTVASKAPRFGEDSLFNHLSSVFSPARQKPVSYGQFMRPHPRYEQREREHEIKFPGGALAKFFVRRDLSGNYSVDDVFRETAPERDSFIHSCEFNAQPCQLEDIKKIQTDFGTCYMFNPNGMRYTVTPGTRNGLRLIINTETYENMKSDMMNAGVKVHIHDKDDIPYVRYVGTAAALSSHTYLAITLVESISLGKPYGSCSSNKLELFPGQNYSQFKCNQQCVTKAMAEQCGCKDYYMPGNASYCTLDKHLHCKVDIGELSCPCPSACHVNAFSSQSSFSSLSKDGVSELLQDQSRFDDDFHNALNYHYRMQPRLAQKVISDLDGFAKAVESLFVFLKRETSFGPTSVTYLTSEAIKEFNRIATRDIEIALSFLPDLMIGFSCAEKFLRARDTEIAIAQSKVHRFDDLLDKLVSDNDTQVANDNTLLTTMATNLKDTISVLMLPFDYHAKCYGNVTNSSVYIPVTLFANKTDEKTCNESFDQVNKKIVSTSVDALTPNPGETINDYWNRVRKIVMDLQVVVDELLSLNRHCTNSYSNVLQEINDWLVSVSLDDNRPSIGADFVFEKEILTAKEIFDWFKKDLFNDFKEGKKNVIELANSITSIKFHTFFGEINRFKKKLDDTYLTFLSQDVNLKGPSRIKTLYKHVLHHMANLQPYVSRNLGLRKSARTMKIWQKPKVNLDGMKLVEYNYDKAEVWRAWPPTVNVKNFYSFQSSRVLQLHVGDFFHELADKLDEFEIEHGSLYAKTYNSFQSLNNSMAEVQRSSVIDEQFILNNFLKLDVYYGELTHELIEQTPAYTTSDFFSDMGGYLGLLLGASVLTICELLDVIFYNSALKCHKGRKMKDNEKMYV